MMTPFEETGTATTVAEAEDFCDALAAAHEHVSIQTWGTPSGITTRLGMFTVTVGTGPPKVAVIGSIHGNEPSGREAALIYARDLAESTNPTTTTYLDSHAWSFMPQANPYGTANDRRLNANGVDLNRDFDTLNRSETQAIDAWLQASPPRLVVDLHEMQRMPPDVETGRIYPPAHPSLIAVSDQLDTALEAELSASWDWGQYPEPTQGTLRREGPPRWSTVVALVEVSRFHSPSTAVSLQLASMQSARTHHAANAATYEAARIAAGGSPVINRRRGASVVGLI